MMQQIFVMVVIPCVSAFSQPLGGRETIVHVCPETVRFMVREEEPLLTPRRYAEKMHLTEGPRDDRMPPEVKKAEKPKKVTAKKKSSKSKKTKRKKRRT